VQRAVTFDLFGTLVSVTRPPDPAAAVARELRERSVPVPEDWADAYGEIHVEAPEHAEVPLPAHVAAALRSRGIEPRTTDPTSEGNAVRRAVVAAFDPEVTVRPDAREAVMAAAERGPVGVLSNCSAPEVVGRALLRAGLRDAVDVTVTSAGCGWRKPHPEAFETVADRLGVPTAGLVHVGDDPAADGGVTDVGGRFVDVAETPLSALPAWLSQAPEEG
jgi:FMN phosphatase YigB (HAD superfamily)